jgi:hypothetical protein
MENNLIPRIGTFFILIGLGLLILFIGSAFSGSVHIGYFFLSAIAFFFGTIFRRRGTRPQSGRFGTINTYREKNRQRREEKETKAPQKK